MPKEQDVMPKPGSKFYKAFEGKTKKDLMEEAKKRGKNTGYKQPNGRGK